VVFRLIRLCGLDDSHEAHKEYIEGVHVQLLDWVQMRVFGADVLCREMPNETVRETLKEMKSEAADLKLAFSTLSFKKLTWKARNCYRRACLVRTRNVRLSNLTRKHNTHKYGQFQLACLLATLLELLPSPERLGCCRVSPG